MQFYPQCKVLNPSMHFARAPSLFVTPSPRPMSLASSMPSKRKRDEGEESAITIIGPLGPTEEHREYRKGDCIRLLGLSAIVGDPRLGLCFDGQMEHPLWNKVNNIICDIIDAKEDQIEAEEKSGEAVDPDIAANIESLDDELKRFPEGEFVADVFVLIEHANSWVRYNILGRTYDIFFGVPCAENAKMYTTSLHIQLAKPRDVIEQLRMVGPETMSHGLFALGIERGEDGTGYCEDWEPLDP